MRTFARIVADRQKHLGLSQRQLASAVGVRQPTLHNWLSGRRSVPDGRLDRLLDALQLDEDGRRDAELAALLTTAPKRLVALVEALDHERNAAIQRAAMTTARNQALRRKAATLAALTEK